MVRITTKEITLIGFVALVLLFSVGSVSGFTLNQTDIMFGNVAGPPNNDWIYNVSIKRHIGEQGWVQYGTEHFRFYIKFEDVPQNYSDYMVQCVEEGCAGSGYSWGNVSIWKTDFDSWSNATINWDNQPCAGYANESVTGCVAGANITIDSTSCFSEYNFSVEEIYEGESDLSFMIDTWDGYRTDHANEFGVCRLFYSGAEAECWEDANCSANQFCDQTNNTCLDYNINLDLENQPSSIYANWSTARGGIDYYNITRHHLPLPPLPRLAGTGQTALYNDTSVTNERLYYYQVEGLNGSVHVVAKSALASSRTHECFDDDDCFGGWCSANYTCESVLDECQDDADCNATSYCNTFYDVNKNCMDELPDAGICARNHMCSGDNCTAHTTNAAVGDYPPFNETYAGVWIDPYGGASNWGYCTSGDIVACDVNGDCNISIEFCNPNGVCQIFSNLTDYCEDNGWCAGDLICVNEECVNASISDQSECIPADVSRVRDPDQFWTTEYDTVWSSCMNITGCGSDGSDCYCKLNESADFYQCAARSGLWGSCNESTVSAGYTQERCKNDYLCRGGNASSVSCVPEDWQCLYNRLDDGSQPYLGFNYCSTYSYFGAFSYCGDNTHLCFQQGSAGDACSYNYECRSLDCNDVQGVCRGGDDYYPPTNDSNHTVWDGEYTLLIRDLEDIPVDSQVLLAARYIKSNNVLTSGECTWVSTGGFTESGGTLTYNPESFGGDYEDWVTAAGFSGNYTVYITCVENTGEGSLTAWDRFEIVLANTTRLHWLVRPRSGECDSYHQADVRYMEADGTTITDATCTLTINSVDYAMTEFGTNGTYMNATIQYPSTAGEYTIDVECTKTGLAAANATRTVGVTCGAVTTTTQPPSHCANGVRDSDESDIDCGGSCPNCDIGEACFGNSDCAEWCNNGVCDIPTCEDGVQNGLETGIDCGGICPPCSGCVWNNNCAADGSQTCVDGECTYSTCATDADCPSISWIAGTYPDLYEIILDRQCDLSSTPLMCRFGNSTQYENSSVYMRFFPLSEQVYNESGNRIYLSNCAEENNGFRIITNEPSEITYWFGASAFSPAYPTSSWRRAFDNRRRRIENTGLIDELCLIASGNDRIYSRAVFMACPSTASSEYCSTQEVDTLTFRVKFEVNVTLNETERTETGFNYIEFALSRNGTCEYRINAGDAWDNFTNIDSSNITSDRFEYNHSFYEGKRYNPVVYWQCNSTFGEFADGTYRRNLLGGFQITKWMIYLLAPLFLLFLLGVLVALKYM